jgi:hypothetical protein
METLQECQPKIKPVAGGWLLDTGGWILDARYWQRVTCHWKINGIRLKV